DENSGEINSQIPQSDNKIIHGDNLLALKSLMPEFGGKIKCIYIDPPYNTGNENWAYNDNVNDPKIKKWLNKVVGSDDLSRHDKWLCMMYPRLRLLHELLSKDGVIFISIDDNEIANLKLLCDEIFGERNFVANLPRLTSPQRPAQEKFISVKHDYLLIYAKDKNLAEFNKIIERNFEKILTDNIGKYIKGDTSPILASVTQGYSEGGDYDFKYNGKIYKPVDSKGNRRRWLWTIERMKKAAELGILVETKTTLRVRNYIDKEFEVGSNLMVSKSENLIATSNDLINSDFQNKNGTDELTNIGINDFEFAKPTNLIKFCLNLATDKNSIILDSFAGSGTTAHVVLELNKKDGGNRKFILIEMNDYANSTTAERIKRVIKGYGDKPNLTATGGSFEYFEIGEKLLLENGNLNEKVATEKIKEYIYFSETGQKLNSQNENYLLGICENTAYYFIYEKDKSTSLNLEFLSNLVKAENYVIYADNHTLGENQLSKYKIKFKKIPRDIAKI
ncbi:MAG: site-specific DNA-methyltransferase, partial [Campylobacter sp.]|nr:site-specific DNA-methyltransferase [Campylobacter sp.]